MVRNAGDRPPPKLCIRGMTDEGQLPTRSAARVAPHEDFVRRLGRRYMLTLVAVAALVTADQAIIQPLLLRLNNYAPVINVAGRQRMLSQRLAKAALALRDAVDEPVASARRTELKQSLGEWSAAHDALRFGSAESGMRPVSSPIIDDEWRKLQADYAAMHASATLLAGPVVESAEASAAAVATLVAHESEFLATMERIVKLMEHEAAAAVRRLRLYAVAVAGMIVALVVALGWAVIKPATSAIRNQVDKLESQVAARTRELDDTLASLRREIAEREETETRNKALAAQLAHADRVESMGHLAAGLAHELNQPLGAIANYAEASGVVLSRSLDEQGRDRLRDYASQIRQASLRAGGIVRRMRNFVRPGAGQTAPVEMTSLIQEVVDLCRPEAALAQIDLEFAPPQGAQLIVSADAIQIQQVLVNLVQNALHAMAETPAERRALVVRVSGEADSVQVDVTDSGPGLARGDPDALFAPFHTTKPDGLGIGLSICRSIIEHHQGTIWARSLPMGGAQFSFVLPLASRHADRPPHRADRVCR